MKAIGISDTSVCGGATLIEDGLVLSSVNEERLDRQKMSTGFPYLAIQNVLELTGTQPDEIDKVFVADKSNYFKPKSSRWEGWLVDYPNKSKQVMSMMSSYVSRFLGNSTIAQDGYYVMRRGLTAGRHNKLEKLLKDKCELRCPIVFVDHHHCHALSAYYTAGYPDATVITLDGGGDGLCSRVYRVKAGRFELLHTLNSYHSIGNYYAYITKICGFTAHKHEGKITGLAARGEPVFKGLLESFIKYDDGDMRNIGNCYFWSAIEKLLKALPKGFKIEDLAASMQAVLEEVAVRYCDHWIRASGIGHVALAGGVFANVLLNQRIHELDSVQSLFIHPGMGDEGLSFGAALDPVAKREMGDESNFSTPIRDVYFGPGYSDNEIRKVLDKKGFYYESPQNMGKRIAEYLRDGNVVARFDGRMEYGPRALGNRSILYQPSDPSANEWLNKKMKRTEFMPFAPAVTVKLANRCFHGISGVEHAAKFMTITFQCTDEMKRLCPGVVHVDGTARPQLVEREVNPVYYDAIDEFYKMTGIPSIINTSFNVHEEPIVCTPDDAVKGFLDCGIDYLAIGPFLVKNPNEIAKKQDKLN
jgi:carbamoyltransferase